MKQQTQNTFNDGLISDLVPLVTPNTVLTDAVNATLITYNGNEFQLQNDMGNAQVERARLPVGFIPIGMKEYGGIIYVVSYNPETGEEEYGSFPSPERDFDTSDFENLTPSKFKTSDFVVNTGTDVNERTSVISKLVEPELLQLSPGDMYVVVYNINDPLAGNNPNEIDSQADMDAYISKDVLNRKLFNLKFYKITDDNNLNVINPDDIKVIQDKPDIEDEYVYFKENSKGTIAVGLELETLDQFDANVIDTSRVTNANKSVAIEAVGFSDSLADFEGIEVEITTPSVEKFYVQKTGDNKKVSARLTDLSANDIVNGTITPYSKYALYPKLKKTFQVEIGKFASAGSGVNNIFRWFYSRNSIRVDFDFKFEGNSQEGLHLYVEFYDPWSDYSIVKTIDNPTYYGSNSVVMELIDEPATKTFNSTTRGGTPTNLLIDNADTEFQRTQLNSTNLIRTNSQLRRNHFYIVRVSGVDRDFTTTPITYVHYDFYKGLYTNDMFNDIYNLQSSLQPDSPQYVADFNTLDFSKDNIKYDSIITKTRENNSTGATIEVDESMKTDTKYYIIKESQINTDNLFYKTGNTFSNNRSFNLQFNLVGTDYIFGDFKESVLSIELDELEDSLSTDPNKAAPVVTNIGWDGDTEIDPVSVATWNAVQVNSKNYIINTDLVTSRWVRAKLKLAPGPTLNENNRATVHKEFPMRSQLYHNEVTGNVTYFSGAVIHMDRLNGTRYSKSYCFPRSIDFQTQLGEVTGGKRYGALFGKFFDAERVACWNNGRKSVGINWPAYPAFFSDLDAIRMPVALMVRGSSEDGFYVTKSTDMKAVIAFFNTLYAHSAVSKDIFVYYPDQATLKSNSTITTTADYNTANITTKFSPIGGVKTYLSTFYLGAQALTTDFSTDIINSYIQSRLGDSLIVDNKDNIEDGFIPYVDEVKTTVTPLNIPSVTINQAAISGIIDAYRAGEIQWKSDDMIKVTSKYNHGQLYTKDDKYSDFVKWFKLAGWNTGVEINEATVYITTNTSNLAAGDYIDAARSNSPASDNAPDLLVDIAITSPS